jgi:flavin reductase (DIM6/NTAB) family NADH-FMN oxidoreductase RutF
MQKIDPAKLMLRPFELLDLEWALLVAGRDRPNPMTVSWGGFGTLWHLPVITVYVRHSRHTHSLLVERPEFSLSFLSAEHRGALELCGTRSGRDTDKWRETGLTASASDTIQVPRIAEAHLAFECRLLTHVDLDPEGLPGSIVEEFYKQDPDNPHGAFIGQVLAAHATERFLR